ncbi:Pentatricopeptide repeat-containing protein At1g20230 [Linum perenne]
MEARKVFDKIPQPNVISWTSMIASCSQNGKDMEALELFREMQMEGIKPNSVTIPCLLPACGNIGACRVHNNLAIGEVAAHKLFELEPTNPGNYVLLSNIYASKSMWVEVDMVRERMKSEGLKKNPGCSWIEIKNKVHMLLAGDKSHPQMPEITKKLAEVRMEMQKSGYLPHTDFVLQDVEEHDKEEMLCDHSEKLAVALGLVNTSSGFPLQVIKNLRICGDCHVVIKFISSFEKREIFVRDTNLFHHFKDGTCSCGDYW